MEKMKIKPLSINDAWQGRRYKTPKYIRYTKDVSKLLLMHKKPKIEKGEKVRIHYIFHIFNMRSDVDNFIKGFQDILFTWLGIDDSRIVKLTAEKIKCEKGQESIEWDIEIVK